MCGIYAIVPAAGESPAPDTGQLLADMERMLLLRPVAGAFKDAAVDRLLESVSQRAYELVQRGGFLELVRDASLPSRLTGVRRALATWVGTLELHADHGCAAQPEAIERVDRMITLGRDLIWQLERDIVGAVAPVRALLGGDADGDADREAWSHAWALNLAINAIDRLEVRGRDSAGLAIFARIPDAALAAGLFPSDRGDHRGTESIDADDAEDADDADDAVVPLGGPSTGAGVSRRVLRLESSVPTILFLYRVANEVGEMGDNGRELRRAISSDPVFQRALRAPGAAIELLAHTRWASNGVVSISNCHPVDSTVYRGDDVVPGSPGSVLAVLNGDIENFRDLQRRYVTDRGLRIDDGVGTDAKIIPIVVAHHYRETGDMAQAFRAALEEFEGSMTIGLMSAENPGELLLAQKGGGQGLYLGLAPGCVAAASEIYGLVEMGPSYIKADGATLARGEAFRVRRDGEAVGVESLSNEFARRACRDRIEKAEITTRDIHRGEHRHFLLKEIRESAVSVRKTMRGKFESDAEGKVRIRLDSSTLPPRLIKQLAAGWIRRVVVIGQGTAAVAGEGVARSIAWSLSGLSRRISVVAMKATEFSGHHVGESMGDTLIVAISQSGTTADTNRAVDMARERGAWIIGIVNRRNSDLVFKSHGVLYTSDGRDIEMSVASTKAFYSQSVAGLILALAIGEALGALPRSAIEEQCAALGRLPGAMEMTLGLEDAIRDLAERHAVGRRFWAVVGSGSGKIAADEIRIKLSELCYRSIATDVLEDKKHIDLSAEPLVLVVAAGLPRELIPDAVKEVAIFKAHRSAPLVIADAGEDRFAPYAAGVIHVPECSGALSYLLPAMVGHLFGYYAAAAFDDRAAILRRIRAGLVEVLGEIGARRGEGRRDLLSMPAELVEGIREFQGLLLDGALDGCVSPRTATSLTMSFQVALGRLSADVIAPGNSPESAAADAVRTMIRSLSAAIDEVARPIDAIKHQAKTVTVGVSRASASPWRGPLWSIVRYLNLDPQAILDRHRKTLSEFEPLVERIEGATLYRVEGLDPLGRVGESTTIRVERKLGATSKLRSRCELPTRLSGTKGHVADSREIHFGYGRADGQKILVIPVIGECREGHILLCHLELTSRSDLRDKLRALGFDRERPVELAHSPSAG